MGCGASAASKYAPEDERPEVKPSAGARRKSSVSGVLDTFDGFISHCKKESAMEARFLQTELERLMSDTSAKLFLDSDDLRDLSQLAAHVRSSKCILLCLTAQVLQRPYCLIPTVP